MALIFLRKPAAGVLEGFLAEIAGSTFSYAEQGQTEGGRPAGYDVDHNRVRLGEGGAVFEAACGALRRWEMFPRAWTVVHPAGAPFEAGTNLAVAIRALGLWWVNGARIVYAVDDAGPPRRFGFAYGTLESHVERGEERFTVEWLEDDSVWYDLRAFSRPRLWAVRLGYPVARALQRRFVRDSQAAMLAAVARL